MKMKFVQLLLAVCTVFLFSCNTANNEALDKQLNEISDTQKVILKKIETMDKSIKNLALANKNQPADNKKKPPQADPNKVYNIPIGDSFTQGPDNAAVTIIEWSDFQ